MRYEPPVAGGRREAARRRLRRAAGRPAGPAGRIPRHASTAAGRLLTGEIHIEGDPRITFSDADRRTRQTALLNLYALQKSLAAARLAGATAAGQLDTPGGRGINSSRADTGSRLTQVQADLVIQSNAVNNLSRAIEGYSGLPTADQRRQLDWAFDDAARAIEAMNKVLQTDTAASRLTVPAKLTKDQ